MFKDEMEKLEEEIETLLLVYDAEQILADNDLTMAEALAILVSEGFIILPEEKPV